MILLLPNISYSNGFEKLDDKVLEGVLESLILEDNCRSMLKEQAPEALEYYRNKSKTSKTVDSWIKSLDEEALNNLDEFANEVIDEWGDFGCIMAYGFLYGVVAAESDNY